MSGLLLRRGVRIALVLSVLGLCLFGDCAALRNIAFLAPTLLEITAVLADPGTQWMVFLCAGIYLFGFVVFRARLARGGGRAGGEWSFEGGAGSGRTAWGMAAKWPEEPAFWLTGLIVLGALAYALDYPAAVKSTQALTLVGAAVVGRGAAFWENRKQKAESRNVGRETVLALIILLATAAVWQVEPGHLFQYRGQGRWTGPWDNPNTFGMLMGVGVILAVGRLVQSRINADCGVRSAEFSKRSAVGDLNLEPRTLNFEPPIARWGSWLRAGLFGVDGFISRPPWRRLRGRWP
jgi:hypothetical protein